MDGLSSKPIKARHDQSKLPIIHGLLRTFGVDAEFRTCGPRIKHWQAYRRCMKRLRNRVVGNADTNILMRLRAARFRPFQRWVPDARGSTFANARRG